MGLRSAVKSAAEQVTNWFGGGASTGANLVIPRWTGGGPLDMYNASPLVMACVSLQTNAMAQTRLMVVDVDGKEVLGAALPFDINKPTKRLTQFAFLQRLVFDILLYNHCYIYAAQPRSLFVNDPLEFLDPEGMAISTSATGRVYTTSQGISYLEEDVIHIEGDPSRTSKLYALKDAIGLGVESRRFLRRYFQNGTFVGGFIETESPARGERWQAEAKIIGATLSEQFSGEGQHKVMVLGKGSKFSPLSIELESMISRELKEQVEVDILQAFNTPRQMAESILSTATGLGSDVAKQARQTWWETVLVPMHKRITEALNASLFTDLTLRLAFDYSTVASLALDRVARIKWALPAFQNTGISFHEFRRQLGMEERLDIDDFWLVPMGAMVTKSENLFDEIQVNVPGQSSELEEDSA